MPVSGGRTAIAHVHHQSPPLYSSTACPDGANPGMVAATGAIGRSAINCDVAIVPVIYDHDTGIVGTVGEITPTYVFCKKNKWFKDRKRGHI